MNKRAYAKHIFVHYMTFTWDQVGIDIDSYVIAEWEGMVDSMIDAAKEEMNMDKIVANQSDLIDGNKAMSERISSLTMIVEHLLPKVGGKA